MDLSRILLATALVAAAVPAGLSTTSAEDPCSFDQTSTAQFIQLSTPLEGQLSGTQMVYEVTHRSEIGESEASWTNGLDGYVYQLNCEPNPLDYKLRDVTPAQDIEADYAIEFYDAEFEQVGDTVRETQDGTDAQLAGDVPTDARHVVVLIEEAPLVSGFAIENGEPTPYAAKFHLTLEAPG
jgi:hypothetical protein